MYYLKKSGKILGPFELSKLQGMVEKGKITPDNSISEDRKNWVEASMIKELFPELAVSTSAPPPQIKQEPEVNLQKELKVKKQDDSDSYVNKMVAPSSSPPIPETVSPNEESSNEEEVEIKFMSVFWNPVYALPLLCAKIEDQKITRINALFVFLNIILFWFAIALSGIVERSLIKILLMFFIAFIPVVSLLLILLLLKKMFSTEDEDDDDEDSPPKWKELFLTTGLTLFPAMLVIFLVALVNLTSILAPPQIIALLAGLGIYAFGYSVLLLFNACTRLFNIRGSATIFVVSTLLLVSAGITVFFIKLLLI
jgi:uncharacterized protein DUF4339